MGLSIKDRETETLVRQLARRQGTGLTETIKEAVRAKISQQSNDHRDDDEWWKAIEEIQRRSRALPIIDPRSPDEILGYDADGAPA
jgi:antitoxin VapB